VHNPFWAVASAVAAATVLLLSGIQAALMDTGYGNAAEFLLGVLFATLTLAVFFALSAVALPGLRRLPVPTLALTGSALLALWFLYSHGPSELLTLVLNRKDWHWPPSPGALSMPSLILIVLAIASASALLAAMANGAFTAFSRPRQFLTALLSTVLLALAIAAVAQLASSGHDPYPNDGAAPVRASRSPDFDDPSKAGSFAVATFSYGAGSNPRRPEYGVARDLESRTVDARKILPEWKDFKQAMRERYWGFGLSEAPLNGRIWAPEDTGRHPLVLIVHGNHGMEDYSDDGYAYLGELLASRGFIAVSVDQNYINGSWSGDFRGKEMPARGWLLLEHLKLWHDWNRSEGHPFYQRIDTENIALIGHSRGGEAVSIAHHFNSLPYFPDDATLKFDYGFQIRSLVAIAQVDQRYSRRLELEDVNFFTIHGSYDSDEPAYHGLRQMNRIRYSGEGYYLKAGAYLHGANHGQFNTGWGRYDYSPPGAWRLNSAPIIPGEEQRQVAKLYISAFLEATLHGDQRYAQLLKDPRIGSAWLPARTLVAQFSDSSFAPIADFEEDLDVTSASLAGSSIRGSALAIWREEELLHRDQRRQGSNGLVVGWRDPDAALTITLPEGSALDRDRSLVFAISGSTERLPDSETHAEDASASASSDPENGAGARPLVIPDLSLELIAGDGSTARLKVSDYAQLVPPVRVQYLKDVRLNKKNYNALWEPVLQYVEIPLQAFEASRPGFAVAEAAALRFAFDQAPEGVLLLDNIGTIGGAGAAPRVEDQ
jgi:hypothetical protein